MKLQPKLILGWACVKFISSKNQFPQQRQISIQRASIHLRFVKKVDFLWKFKLIEKDILENYYLLQHCAINDNNLRGPKKTFVNLKFKWLENTCKIVFYISDKYFSNCLFSLFRNRRRFKKNFKIKQSEESNKITVEWNSNPLSEISCN